MLNDMERSRDGYRGRYRDQHENGSTNRNHQQDRSIRGNYRGHLSHDNNRNGHQTFRHSSPDSTYNYRSSRTSYNARPVSSRNDSSRHYRHHENNDYLSSPNRNSNPTSYYDNHSSSSQFDRSSNHRESYPTFFDEQSIPSNAPFLSNSSYYNSSTSSPVGFSRDRNLSLSSTTYVQSDRNRYMSVSNRRENPSSSPLPPPPPPPVSSYRNERLIDYTSRNTNNGIYMRSEYRPPSPSLLASLSVRVDPYAETYRANDYDTRSERYEIPSNRTNSSSRDYSNHRNDIYRSSSNVSMSSPSSYISREQYSTDVSYRRRSPPRDYDISSTRSNYSSSMNDRDSSHERKSSYSSYNDRPNLKRPSSRYDDNGSIPSKRPMRR